MKVNSFAKSIFLSVVVAVSVLSATTVFAAGAYSDMPNGWSKKSFEHAVSNGFLKGENGKINPKGYLTRAQLATVANRFFKASHGGNISNYVDVQPGDWFYNDLRDAVNMGTFQGSNNKLYPDGYATREEVFVVLARGLGYSAPTSLSVLDRFEDKNDISDWAKNDVAAMVSRGYMFGANGKLKPKEKITREEFAYVLHQLKEVDGNVSLFNQAPGNAETVATEIYRTPENQVNVASQSAPDVDMQAMGGSGDSDSADVAQAIEKEIEGYQQPENPVVPIEPIVPVVPIEEPVPVQAPNSPAASANGLKEIKDQRVNGDIVIEGGVEGGIFTLSNVTLDGSLIIKDGNLDLVSIVEGTKLGKLILSKTDNKIAVETNDSEISNVVVENGKDEVKISGNVNSIDVNCDVPVNISKSQVSDVNLNSVNSFVSINDGSIATNISITADAVYSQAYVMQNSLAETALIASAGSSVNVLQNSEVNNVTISENASGSALIVEKDSLVSVANILSKESTITVKDNSEVSTANIDANAENTVIEVDDTSMLPSIYDKGKNTVVDKYDN